jgi:hypothetical protein
MLTRPAHPRTCLPCSPAHLPAHLLTLGDVFVLGDMLASLVVGFGCRVVLGGLWHSPTHSGLGDVFALGWYWMDGGGASDMAWVWVVTRMRRDFWANTYSSGDASGWWYWCS